jgi:hypothetical protein
MLTSNRGIFRGLKNRLRPEVTRQEMGVYDVRYVDEWGDQTHHAQADRPPGREAFVQMKSVLSDGVPERPNGFASIESFCKWAQAHQIRVLATYPNLVDQPEYHLPAARQSAKTIQDFFSGLQVPMIGNYTDSLLRADQFFDTRYHLTEEAALARTRRLIPQLMPFLFRCPCDNSTRTRARSISANNIGRSKHLRIVSVAASVSTPRARAETGKFDLRAQDRTAPNINAVVVTFVVTGSIPATITLLSRLRSGI